MGALKICISGNSRLLPRLEAGGKHHVIHHGHLPRLARCRSLFVETAARSYLPSCDAASGTLPETPMPASFSPGTSARAGGETYRSGLGPMPIAIRFRIGNRMKSSSRRPPTSEALLRPSKRTASRSSRAPGKAAVGPPTQRTGRCFTSTSALSPRRSCDSRFATERTACSRACRKS